MSGENYYEPLTRLGVKVLYSTRIERVTLGTVKLEVGMSGVKKCGRNEAKDGRS
jgi:hypothetical protein